MRVSVFFSIQVEVQLREETRQDMGVIQNDIGQVLDDFLPFVQEIGKAITDQMGENNGEPVRTQGWR